jgi:hypothetical protein
LILGTTLLSGAFIGALSDPSEVPENLKQIYDALFDFYTDLQADNYDQHMMEENTTLDYNSFQIDLARLATAIHPQI